MINLLLEMKYYNYFANLLHTFEEKELGSV